MTCIRLVEVYLGGVYVFPFEMFEKNSVIFFSVRFVQCFCFHASISSNYYQGLAGWSSQKKRNESKFMNKNKIISVIFPHDDFFFGWKHSSVFYFFLTKRIDLIKTLLKKKKQNLKFKYLFLEEKQFFFHSITIVIDDNTVVHCEYSSLAFVCYQFQQKKTIIFIISDTEHRHWFFVVVFEKKFKNNSILKQNKTLTEWTKKMFEHCVYICFNG